MTLREKLMHYTNDLGCGSDLKQAARQVYMHRNTAGYRFERIKKETGLDPQCFYDLVALLREIGECV